MKKEMKHIEARNKVKALIDLGFSLEDISKKMNIPVGSRFIKKTVKWYRYCIRAKENQKKAIEKHPNLYSKAGKIAQKKHPWIGPKLGKEYGSVVGKIRMEQLRKRRKNL